VPLLAGTDHTQKPVLHPRQAFLSAAMLGKKQHLFFALTTWTGSDVFVDDDFTESFSKFAA